MRGLRYIFLCVILLTAATTYVYSQSWDMFFDKGKEHYDKGNYEKAIKNFELYLKYESDNPKAEVKHLLEQAKKRLAEKAETPTNSEQVAEADIAQLTEKPSPKVTEQPTQAEQPHEEYFIETVLGLNMKMIYVEGGTFMMGASSGDSDAKDWEKPAHQGILDSYYIAEFEVTQSQWKKIMVTTVYQQRDKEDSSNSMRGVGDNYPMYYVSYEEARRFCKELSLFTGRTYLLPTEAQWEFAARGGNKGKNSDNKYSGSYSIDAVAWYDNNSNSSTHPVGQKRANQLGIYDMSGNVWEWCSDRFGSYSSDSQTNPTGPSSGPSRVLRGGGLSSDAGFSRISHRRTQYPSHRDSDSGFRVVCIPE